ncbi:MAG TPA: hypothetical protein DEB10_09565 [Ruminococcaceae bacterium]|nr:hypothetical protein [Oscillospiraceae bacterium]
MILVLWYTICNLWFILLILFGVTIVHEYSFFKAIKTSIISLLLMALGIFVIIMVLILFQDFYGFIITLINEAVFRMND